MEVCRQVPKVSAPRQLIKHVDRWCHTPADGSLAKSEQRCRIKPVSLWSSPRGCLPCQQQASTFVKLPSSKQVSRVSTPEQRTVQWEPTEASKIRAVCPNLQRSPTTFVCMDTSRVAASQRLATHASTGS